MMTQQYITLNQSIVRNLPVNSSRAPQVGDILTFTGEVKVVHFPHKQVELLVFHDRVTGDEVTMSVSALMRAHGTVRLFFKNFNIVGDALETALRAKVVFRVEDIELREMVTPGGVIRVKTLTIDCEN